MGARGAQAPDSSPPQSPTDMSSAAVVARQLRQHHPRSFGGAVTVRGRTGSLAVPPEDEGGGGRVSLRCLAQAMRALSGGVVLLAIGTAMTVVGFYAEPLSTRSLPGGNRTEVDPHRQYHLHNLTYVGPVIMGLGGLVLVAGFVLTYDGKVVPARAPQGPPDNPPASLYLPDKL